MERFVRAVVVAALVLAGLVWLTTSSAGPRLASGKGDDVPAWGQSQIVSQVGARWNLIGPNLCLVGADAATITGVRLIEANGLRVRDFAVREYDAVDGYDVNVSLSGPLGDSGFHRQPVTSQCGDTARTTFIALHLSVDASRGEARGLAIDYVLGERRGSHVLPSVSLASCVGTVEPWTECPTPDDDSRE